MFGRFSCFFSEIILLQILFVLISCFFRSLLILPSPSVTLKLRGFQKESPIPGLHVRLWHFSHQRLSPPRPPINTARHGACAAAFAGYLYVSGSSRFPVEPHGMTPTSKFQKYPNVAWKQNHIVLCLFFSLFFSGFFWFAKIFPSSLPTKNSKIHLCKDWW